MAHLELPEGQGGIEGTLELQTTHAYEAFAKAIETEAVADVVLARQLWEGLYHPLLSGINNSTAFIVRDREWVPELIDSCNVQYALARLPSSILERMVYDTTILKKDRVPINRRDDGLEELKLLIDDKKVKYREIQNRAVSHAREGKFGAIVAALEYVRKPKA
ncbi:MAG: hypothetical protein Q8R04_02840 [Nanoarchaeota archaeon]|nr:hypothetical protein [Nanoarchaeota archaeon]